MCDATYGLSIARGSFKFSRGAWTHVSQTVVLNSPGEQDGVFVLKVDGNVTINRSDVFYGDRPQEPDFAPTPSCDPDPQPDNGWGLLGPLLGGLTKSRIRFLDDGTPSGRLSSQAPLDPLTTSASCDTTDADAPTDAPAQQEELEDQDDICNDDCPDTNGTQEPSDPIIPIGFQGVFFRHVLSMSSRSGITLTLYFGSFFFWLLVLFLVDTIRNSLRRKTSLFGLRILRFISMMSEGYSLCIRVVFVSKLEA